MKKNATHSKKKTSGKKVEETSTGDTLRSLKQTHSENLIAIGSAKGIYWKNRMGKTEKKKFALHRPTENSLKR